MQWSSSQRFLKSMLVIAKDCTLGGALMILSRVIGLLQGTKLVQRWALLSYYGGGGGQGGLNLPLPLPFNPSSCPVFVGSCLFSFFWLQNIAQCCIVFPFSSHFPPPWESRFLPPLLPPPLTSHSLFSLSPAPCPPPPTSVAQVRI